MTSVQRLLFSRRRNADGSYDSICERCLRTVASCDAPDALDKFDREHYCTEEDLRQNLLYGSGVGFVRAQLEAVLLHARNR